MRHFCFKVRYSFVTFNINVPVEIPFQNFKLKDCLDAAELPSGVHHGGFENPKESPSKLEIDESDDDGHTVKDPTKREDIVLKPSKVAAEE